MGGQIARPACRPDCDWTASLVDVEVGCVLDDQDGSIGGAARYISSPFPQLFDRPSLFGDLIV